MTSGKLLPAPGLHVQMGDVARACCRECHAKGVHLEQCPVHRDLNSCTAAQEDSQSRPERLTSPCNEWSFSRGARVTITFLKKSGQYLRAHTLPASSAT